MQVAVPATYLGRDHRLRTGQRQDEPRIPLEVVHLRLFTLSGQRTCWWPKIWKAPTMGPAIRLYTIWIGAEQIEEVLESLCVVVFLRHGRRGMLEEVGYLAKCWPLGQVACISVV